MIVNITMDGKAYFGSDPVTSYQLPAFVRNRLTAGTEQKIYLKVDRDARYGIVPKTMAVIRSADGERIAFLVKKAYPVHPLAHEVRFPSREWFVIFKDLRNTIGQTHLMRCRILPQRTLGVLVS
jgi:hypothetical protein